MEDEELDPKVARVMAIVAVVSSLVIMTLAVYVLFHRIKVNRETQYRENQFQALRRYYGEGEQAAVANNEAQLQTEGTQEGD